MSIGKKAAKGFFSVLYRSLLEKVMGLLTIVVLARKLTPYDFGLVSITETLLALISILGTTGLSEFLLAYRKDDEAEIFKAAFWFNVLISVGVFLLFVVVAPLWAYYQNDPRIINISILSGLVFVFSQLQTIPKTWLGRQLMFDVQVKVQAPFIIIIPLAKVAAVFLGFGVYSLVIPNLIFQPILAAVLYYVTKLKPGWHLYKERWGEIYRFTKYLIGAGILSRISEQGNEVILAKRLGLDKLGIFDMAYRMSDLVTGPLIAISGNILSSVLPKFADDKTKFYKNYVSFIKAFSFLVFPILSVFFLTSKPVILLLYGPKWTEAAVPMQLLIVFAAFRAVTSSYGSVMNSFHLNKKSFIVTAVYTPFYLLGAFIGSYYGVVGVAVSVLVVKLVFINWNIKQIMEAVSQPFMYWYKNLSPYFLSCILLIGLLSLALYHVSFNSHLEIITYLVAIATVFAIMYYLLFRIFFARELKNISEFILLTFPKMQRYFNLVFAV